MTTQRPATDWDDERLEAAFVERAARVTVPSDIVVSTIARLQLAERQSPWARLLPAAAALVLVVGLVGGGIAMLTGPGGLTGNPVTFRDGPTPDLRTLDAGAFALDFPADWLAYATDGAVGSGGSILAILTTQAIEDRCVGAMGADLNCVYEQPLEPGTARIFVGTSGFRGSTIFERVAIENGTTTHVEVGGMPAILDEYDVTPADYSLADQWATWQIALPTSLSNVVRLEFMARDPDADAARAAVDEIAASFRFTPPPTPLPADRSLGVPLGRTMLDAQAASFRQGYVPAGDSESVTYLECLPPTTGEDRVVLAQYGPGGDLGWNVVMRCRWMVSAGDDGPFWRIDAVYEWTAGESFGRYRESYWMDAAGAVVATSNGGEVPPARDPSAAPTTPVPSNGSVPFPDPISVSEAIAIRDAGPDGRELVVQGWFSPIAPLSCPYTPATSPIQSVCPDQWIVLMGDPESLVTVRNDGFEGREPNGPAFQIDLDDLDTSWIPALPTVGPAAPIEIVVVGHFDDRRSFACPEEQACRDRFVVDEVQAADGRTLPFSAPDYADGGAASSVEAIRTLVTDAVPGTAILSMAAVNGADMQRIEPNIMAFVPFQEERVVWVVRALDRCEGLCRAGVVGAPQTFVVVDGTDRVFAFDDRQVARQIAGGIAPIRPAELPGLEVVDVEAALEIQALPGDDREIAVRGWIWRLNPDCLVFERTDVEELFFGEGCRSDSLMAAVDGTFDDATLPLAIGQASTGSLPFDRRVEVVLIGHFDDRRSGGCSAALSKRCADMFWVDGVSLDGELGPRDWVTAVRGGSGPTYTHDQAWDRVRGPEEDPLVPLSIGLIIGPTLAKLEPATAGVIPVEMWYWHVTAYEPSSGRLRTFVIPDSVLGNHDGVVSYEVDGDDVLVSIAVIN